MKPLKRIICFVLVFAITASCFLLQADERTISAASSAITSTSKAGRVTVTSGSLNVRASASATSTRVASLAKGSYVTLLSKTGNWWKVEYATGKTGYCSATYITQVTGAYAAYANVSTRLNVRAGAGTGYDVVAKLGAKTPLIVMGTAGNGKWYWILYNGTKVGYCSASYVKRYSSASSSVTYPAISLTTANYKQTDSRWASIKLGTSNTTIAKAGCLTCCIAIVQTYVGGYTVYPHTMSYSLAYGADGTLYWPSYYAFSTSSSYLSTLYNLLYRTGIPVLIGFKNASGGQHWVVVSGYTGGNTLTASGFTIRDPGSNSRTTLNQVMASYPYFYKIAYYA